MKARTQKAIKKLAEERESVKLYKVATGETDLLSFLSDYVKENNLGDTPVAGSTLAKVLNANTRRRKQLDKWIADETNDTYKSLYQKEVKILDDYAETVFLELVKLS